MAADDTINIFQELSSLTDEVDIDWSQGNFGPWLSHLNVLAWPLSVQQAPGSPLYDYYLIQIEGEASFLAHDQDWLPADPTLEQELLRGRYSWQLDAHAIDVFPGGDVNNIELVDTSPATTEGATSYTTGITTTLGGSIGFMGEALTGSVSASVSLDNSTTRTVDDVEIENISMRSMNPPINASWRFRVAAGSPSAQDNCPINVEFLYRTPHGAGLELGLAVSVYMTGGDPDEINSLGNADGDGNAQQATTSGDPVQLIAGFDGMADPYFAGKARFQVYKTFQFAAPPAPPSA